MTPATEPSAYDLGKQRYGEFVANAPAPEEFPSWEAISSGERQAWMNDATAAPAAAVGGATKWMDEAATILADSGHGIHSMALATLAEGVRTGRVISAAPVGGFVVVPDGWVFKRAGVEAFVSGPNGGGWFERKGTLWQRTLFELVDALSAAPAAQPSAKDGVREWGPGSAPEIAYLTGWNAAKKHYEATTASGLVDGAGVESEVQRIHASMEGGYTIGKLRQALSAHAIRVDEAMVERYCGAVEAHLASLTPKDWEIERFDPKASVRRVARIGLEAAIGREESGNG